MAAFLKRALNLPATSTDHFVDDNNSIFEADINAIAEAGITKGCNPPTNNRYCPTDPVGRGAMAAFLKRALNLPATSTDHFVDDNNSIFEADINAIAEAGITKGCNPPVNTNYCPNSDVARGAMAAFLKRALSLPVPVESIPVGPSSTMSCIKSGERCSLTVYLSEGKSYGIEEGVYQVTPATVDETTEFESAATRFTLTLDGTEVSLNTLGPLAGTHGLERQWATRLSFSAGNHTLVGRWWWNGDLIQTNTITVRATG